MYSGHLISDMQDLVEMVQAGRGLDFRPEYRYCTADVLSLSGQFGGPCNRLIEGENDYCPRHS